MAVVLVATLLVGCFAACKPKKKDPGKDYSSALHTLNLAMVLSPNTWNPHTYKSTNDALVHTYTVSNLYEYVYNADYSNYTLEGVMAVGDPVDVTTTYVGNATYKKIPNAATSGFAFRLNLNPDAKWDDGTPITADDYIYSMQALFDRDLINSRASDFYAASLQIANAKGYIYSGKEIMDQYKAGDDETEELPNDKLYFSYDKPNYLFDNMFGDGVAHSVKSLYEKYYNNFTGHYEAFTPEELAEKKAELGTAYDAMTPEQQAEVGTREEYIESKAGDKDKWALYRIETNFGTLFSDIQKYMEDNTAVDSGAAKGFYAYSSALNTLLDQLTAKLYGQSLGKYMYFYVSRYETTEWDEVGIKKIGDYQIDLILDKELIGFYIKYNLNVNWLVKRDIYESCKKQDSKGIWSSDYGTSPEKYMGYGPYKLTKFIDGQVLEFDRSPNWFGFTEKYADTYGTFTRGIDGKVCKQYETDRVVIRQAENVTTRENMFLKGQLDQLGLNAELLSKYRSSTVIYQTEGETTFYGIIASDYDNLKARQDVLNKIGATGATPDKYNKTILTIPEFRQALCYAINRTELCAALYPAGTPAFGLFANAVMSDPANKISYRSLLAAKKTLVEFWGVEYGPDKEFKTLDEAYNAISGYDLEKAKELVDVAYKIAITPVGQKVQTSMGEKDGKGLMTESSIVSIEYCAASASDQETKWYNTFKNNYTKLMEGTSLANKFEYTSNFTLGNKFGDKIKTGSCDTAWGFGWQGGTLDPYDLFQVYVDSAYKGDECYQYDAWVNWGEVELELTLYCDENGKAAETSRTFTHKVSDWSQMIMGADNNKTGLKDWSYSKADDSIRGEVLAALEKTILTNYTTIPLMNEGAVQLKSYKINYGRENYIFGVGRGGVRYMTYNYTDGEWLKYIDSQKDGILTY